MYIKDVDKKYPITSVCKADIFMCYIELEGTKQGEKIEEKLATMTDIDMEYLAHKLSDDYCEQLFWNSLKNIFESKFLNKR